MLNALKKKYKSVLYRVTPLGILFRVTITNDTKQRFTTSREKKTLINGNVYGILAIKK